MSITYLSDKTQDNTLISPVDMLKETIREIEAGELEPDKLLVFMCNTTNPDAARSGFRAANISVFEMVALMEVVKHDLLRTYT